MKVTYAELQRMMNTLNAMIQVKPGPIVAVTSSLGMNANRIESELKAYTLSHNAIRDGLKQKIECILVQVVECSRKGLITEFLEKVQDNLDRWDKAAEEIALAAPIIREMLPQGQSIDKSIFQVQRQRWHQRADLLFNETDLTKIWEAEPGSVVGPLGIDFLQWFAVRVLKKEERDVIPHAQQDEFNEAIEELNKQEVSVKIAKIKIADLIRSEEVRPGYATDVTWFYAAPKMFRAVEKQEPEPEDSEGEEKE